MSKEEFIKILCPKCGHKKILFGYVPRGTNPPKRLVIRCGDRRCTWFQIDFNSYGVPEITEYEGNPEDIHIAFKKTIPTLVSKKIWQTQAL